MTTPDPALLLAREIFATHGIVSTSQFRRSMVARGECDDWAVVQVIAVAIREMMEAAAYIATIEPDEDAAGCPATWADFVQIVQAALRNGEHLR